MKINDEKEKNIDLVNITNRFSAMMYTNDLAYKQLPENMKHYTLEQHEEDLKNKRKPGGYVYKEENDTIGLFSLFKKLMINFWNHSVDFSVIDIGSQYGLFSMELASFIKKQNKKNKIYSFDCGIASKLCLENIKLNLLDDIITFERKAVTNSSEQQRVYYDSQHSEDNHIIKRDGANLPSYNLEGITLDDYFKDHSENFIIKIDTQGAEPLVFEGMKKLFEKRPTILFEFTPWVIETIPYNPLDFLNSIPEDYFIFVLPPSTNTISQINRNDFENLIRLISESVEKHVDIFIISKSISGSEDILNQIKKAKNFSNELSFKLQ